MSACANGTRITKLTHEYLVAQHDGRKYRIDFKDYPYFLHCPLNEIHHVVGSAEGLHWVDCDIDIELAHIGEPQAGSVVSVEQRKKTRQKAMRTLGTLGGMVSGGRKAAASRVNGRKGGRPRKTARA